MEPTRRRKTRSDKGLIMATERDVYVLAWISEQYAVRFDQIQKLLARFPDKDKPFRNGKFPAATTVRDQLARWKAAGWIEYERALGAGNSWAWATKKGLGMVDLDEIYKARRPADTRIKHCFAVNNVRLWMDRRYTWISERRLRSEIVVKKGEKIGAIPDAMIVHPKQGRVAIEVQISPLKPAEMFVKVRNLVREYHSTAETIGYEAKYPTIWFYVPSEGLKDAVEEAIEGLRDDEQKRVSVGLEPSIIAQP